MQTDWKKYRNAKRLGDMPHVSAAFGPDRWYFAIHNCERGCDGCLGPDRELRGMEMLMFMEFPNNFPIEMPSLYCVTDVGIFERSMPTKRSADDTSESSKNGICLRSIGTYHDNNAIMSMERYMCTIQSAVSTYADTRYRSAHT